MEMTIEWLGIAVLVSFVCSLVSSVVLVLFGGYGGYLLLKKEVQGLKFEVEKQDEKLIREVKQRAAFRGVEKGRVDKEVDAILNAAKTNPDQTFSSPGTLEQKRSDILKRARGV